MKRLKIHIRFLILVSAMGMIAGCENGAATNPGTSSTGSTTTFTGTTLVGSDTYYISNLTLGTTATNGAFPVSIYFNTSIDAATPLSNHCSASSSSSSSSSTSSSLGCGCQFSWTELNSTTGSVVQIPHIVTIALNSVQAAFISCETPSNWSTIADNTQVTVTIVPLSGNTTSPFSVLRGTPSASASGWVLNKETIVTTTPGSFSDSQGNTYSNIYHYSCYQVLNSSTLSITNAGTPITDPTSGNSITAPLASQFCAGGTPGGAATANCPIAPSVGISAKTNYFNLYVQDSEQGSINQTNGSNSGGGSYVCPQVKESLYATGSNSNASSFYWPLDSTFALSTTQSTLFSVGVDAFSRVATSSGSSDPNNTSVNCAGVSSGSSANPGLLQACMGFAAAPSSAGSCPTFINSSGQVVLTYRLRRFVAIYPPTYSNQGTSSETSGQAIDTVYILDRPVSFASSDPLHPYTMLGPKPCPYAYYDTTGVTGTAPAGMPVSAANGNAGGVYFNGATGSPIATYAPSYLGTNNTRWTNTNVDGLQYPNIDQYTSPGDPGSQYFSCSAAVPVLNSAGTHMTIATVNPANPRLPFLYIRPINAWSPHYEEDTSFQACAPQAEVSATGGPVDPPLHFARDAISGNVSWCAENYPTQNDSVPQLDAINLQSLPPYAGKTSSTAAYGGFVAPFTSHVSKNSVTATAGGGQNCSATLLTSIPTTPSYPVGGFANHPAAQTWDTAPFNMNETCDRTVENTTNNWGRFPLLAPPTDVENALQQDSGYNCMITFDNGGGKAGIQTPTSGCCGVLPGTATPVVNITTAFGAPAALGNKAVTAHLEPKDAIHGPVSCGVPTY